MLEKPRVFVTGMGMLTAAGLSVEENWHAVNHGECHLAPIQAWDLSNWPSQLGGELKNFQPAKHLPDRKLMKAISMHDAMGILAAGQAIEHSGLLPSRSQHPDPDTFNDMTGVFVGSPGNKHLQQYDFLPLLAKTGNDMQAFASELFNEVHPMWLLRILPNNVLAYTGILYGFKGPNHNITNHAVSGMQAMLEAYYAIQAGQIERAVVVAYDLGIDPQSIFYYEKLGLLSNAGLHPFDQHHSGTVLADGAAALVIESEQSMKARGASPYVEILGGQSNTEGMGLFGIDHDAHALEQLLRTVLQSTQARPEDLAFLIAHGNGSKGSDDSEALALNHVFKEYDLPISGFKWSMGHTLIASGLVDTVLATKALTERQLPGLATLKQKHTLAADLNLSQENRPLTQGNIALIINRGFASMNACLAIKACEPN
jgi:3-oxoacyl-[acyl-carrier-protein] synthase I